MASSKLFMYLVHNSDFKSESGASLSRLYTNFDFHLADSADKLMPNLSLWFTWLSAVHPKIFKRRLVTWNDHLCVKPLHTETKCQFTLCAQRSEYC